MKGVNKITYSEAAEYFKAIAEENKQLKESLRLFKEFLVYAENTYNMATVEIIITKLNELFPEKTNDGSRRG